jgi:hypothetical protein
MFGLVRAVGIIHGDASGMRYDIWLWKDEGGVWDCRADAFEELIEAYEAEITSVSELILLEV